MPRTLTPAVNESLETPYGGGAWLYLCVITVPGQTTQRMARNTEAITYDGTSYPKGNFDFSEVVRTSDGSVPRVNLRVAHDLNRTVEQIVNNSFGALGGEIKLIKVGSEFLDESIPALEADYEVLASESDDEMVTFTLGIPNPLSRQVPTRCYSSGGCPFATPSLFKGPECGYAGSDTTCGGFYLDCIEKSNEARWGGDLGLDPNGLML